MKYFAIFVFLGFIGMAVFGFAGMAQSSEHNGVSCLAIAANGGVCPKLDGWLAFSAFHLAALKKFSTAIFAAAVLSLILVLFAVLLTRPVFEPKVYRGPDFAFEKIQTFKDYRLVHWFSLHENSPSVI